MGKKKFIDKKKSATFQLLARDTSDPNYHGGLASDRVFVRVDNNPYSVHGFLDEDTDYVAGDVSPGYPDETNFLDDPNSIFADAPGDDEDDEVENPRNQTRMRGRGVAPLPDHARREILELGLPDDGYNYLIHLREIRNTGGGSSYYHNSKAKLDQLPLDVKAYDASRVHIPKVDEDSNENSIYQVASRTVGVRIQKAVDHEVAALLDDDLSRFGSDMEDLEEDFVVQANLPEEGENVLVDKNVNFTEQPEVIKRELNRSANYASKEQGLDSVSWDEPKSHNQEASKECGSEKPRIRRLLDEQFDVFEQQEYGTDSDYNDNGSMDAEGECLAEKLNDALRNHAMDELELDDKYKAPADFLCGNEVPSKEVLDSAADVIRRCAEYAEIYSNENQNNEDVVVLQESSDESEVWDCETIVSTYSNLDNHPGKIVAPENTRKKKLSETFSRALSSSGNVISLRGKEKLPVEFLPHSKKVVSEKMKEVASSRTDMRRRKPHGQESKEEKKERKAAVKEERREARRVKKEMKGLYKCEAQRAQKVVAVSTPCSIHIM
ncbi:PREDICTED: protein LTV1 homolog [Nelumbo nucifera]|uniref:Protein LTV1 homolog n=2 Tax=Nelumbo nucifera TaxID=4432 RepID=A0A1U8AAV1_NELNU|nr:PREDICTED: protein LTV1 homolog [Nelumbo nucifera]DAD46949.1 TPA_asm: hypothetical protein HUJ06_016886 [Nelumbo nucifera]